MKFKKDHRDVVYNINGVNYVGSYDSKGNYHPPCRPPKNGCSCESKDQTRTTVWKGGGMKRRNKKTGEIGNLRPYSGDGRIWVWIDNISKPEYRYNSLADLNAEWEDYEEPKEHWCVTMYGGITRIKDDEEPIDDLIEIGNYFNSKEDAYDAWDKLKAWKRLKDNGFKFEGIKEDYTRILQEQKPFRTGKRYLQFNKSEDEDWMKENWGDLSLLFSEEEE